MTEPEQPRWHWNTDFTFRDENGSPLTLAYLNALEALAGLATELGHEVTRLRQELAEAKAALEYQKNKADIAVDQWEECRDGWDYAESALTAERALRTRLVEALERYGHHERECLSFWTECTCGLTAVLAEARALEVKPASVPGDEQPGSG